MNKATPAHALVAAAAALRDAVARLRFGDPVAFVYHPLDYAWRVHEKYLNTYGTGPKRVIFLGMNPGPFGMAQTGIPFGEIDAVRDWLQIEAPVGKPHREHRKRPVTGFACPRSEVSGRRLWGLFAERFDGAPRFFAEHFVANYCPLVFMSASGGNITPDKLPAPERRELFHLCDEHLRRLVEALQPEWLIGIGGFAAKRARELFPEGAPRIGQILHPSPASPAANRDWAGQVTRQLQSLRLWR